MTLRLANDTLHLTRDATARVSGLASNCLFERLRGGVAAAVIIALIPSGVAFGQLPPPPPQYAQINYAQLEQLVAPIALYPDSLVAQILAAATYPNQVVDADHLMQANIGAPPPERAAIANTQPWDPSVKALTAFPSVLANMDRNIEWTSKLGNAYYNQPQDVMGAVQTMRRRAYEAGTLHSTPQLAVVSQPGSIVIQPVNPTVVYVPVYNPWAAYGAAVPVYPVYAYVPPPPPPSGGVVVAAAIGFTAGVAITAFSSYSWGCAHWAPNWYSHTVVYNNATYVSHSVTVVNHGYYGYYDHAPSARSFNQQVVYGSNGYIGSRTASTYNGHTNVILNGPNGTATRSTTQYYGGNSTTVTGPNGQSATRTITGRGTGNVNATITGSNGTYSRNTQYYAGGNSTTVTGVDGQSASRSVTGRGTGNVTATISGPNGAATRNTQYYPGGNATTFNGTNGQTASRTITGVGTGNVNAVSTGPNGETFERQTTSRPNGSSTQITRSTPGGNTQTRSWSRPNRLRPN